MTCIVSASIPSKASSLEAADAPTIKVKVRNEWAFQNICIANGPGGT